MPFRSHTSRMIHGKRVRVEFEAKDDSQEAVVEMLAEIRAYDLAHKKADAAKVVRTSFRKKKV